MTRETAFIVQPTPSRSFRLTRLRKPDEQNSLEPDDHRLALLGRTKW